MVIAVVLAWLFPSAGAEGGWLHPEILTKAGVALIFFLHGVALSFGDLKAGMLRWPIHLLVQGCTFLLFPLLGMGLLLLPGVPLDWCPPALKLGLFYLCALPSTVSSSVAMTAAAKGDVPIAVFNATISSLIGVFATPLWIGVALKTQGTGGEAHALPLGSVILDLMLWLVLPLIVGQIFRPLLGAWVKKNKAFVNKVDRCTILLLVYTSFCDSVKRGVWTGHGIATLLVTLVASLILFGAVFFATGTACDLLNVPRKDRIAAVFCGSKKSLASGVPMAQLIFGANPGMGLILLPIMIYHPLQLFICSLLADRWAREPHTDDNAATAAKPVAK